MPSDSVITAFALQLAQKRGGRETSEMFLNKRYRVLGPVVEVLWPHTCSEDAPVCPDSLVFIGLQGDTAKWSSMGLTGAVSYVQARAANLEVGDSVEIRCKLGYPSRFHTTSGDRCFILRSRKSASSS